jgi:pyruvate dehydrogenase E1 component
MFGFQRVGDLIWLAGDIKSKGFMLGATAGRTTLNGEGLQHQDGHGQLLASAIPTLMTYDPAFAYELAVIIQDGMRRMYQEMEDIFYYITLYNENYAQPPMPEGVEQGILRGLYKLKAGPGGKKLKAQIFGSGPIINSALKAQEILARDYDVSTDVWSATSYKLLRNDALECDRWNRLHPTEKPKKSYLQKTIEREKGVFVAVSDNMKIVADQIAPWVPGGLTTLGPDGFGRSESRENLRRFFEIDAESTVVATLQALAQKGEVKPELVTKAMKDLGMNPEKAHPFLVRS